MKKDLVIFLLISTFAKVVSGQASLSLHLNDKTQTWSHAELKNHPSIQTVLLPKDPSRKGQPTRYLALSTADLLSKSDFNESNNRTVEVSASDGMTVSFDLARLTNRDNKRSIAYLALEPVGRPWHEFKPGQKTGPYFLFWINPELSQVGAEEWPFQVIALKVQKSLEETYPLIVPDSKLSRQHSVQKGFQTFVKNCFVCHTLNRQGASQLGPI